MIESTPYPESRYNGSLLKVPNPPAACLFCKKIISAGDPCRSDRGFFVCEQEACFKGLAAAIEVNQKGPKWMNLLLNHLQFQDHNRSRFWSKEAPLSWDEWAKMQGKVAFPGTREIAIFDFAEFWQLFINRYKKGTL